MSRELRAMLNSVDWERNIRAFFRDGDTVADMHQRSNRLAVWARQLESADRDNPALSFIREMQVAAQDAVVLTAVSLYKPAASAIRTMVETAMYYTFFRQHLCELATLVRDPDYALFKKDIIDYHRRHTPRFVSTQNALGLLSKLEPWYRRISSIVHGQIPGAWLLHTSIAEIKPSRALQRAVSAEFAAGEEIVHRLFLCTAAQEMWHDFATQSKRTLLAGMGADAIAVLQLDRA